MNHTEARESLAVLLREAEIRSALGRDSEDLLPLLEASWAALSDEDRAALRDVDLRVASLRVA